MKGKRMLTIPIITGVLAVVGGRAICAQDKYTVKVPGGLAFSEFRQGTPSWQRHLHQSHETGWLL